MLKLIDDYLAAVSNIVSDVNLPIKDLSEPVAQKMCLDALVASLSLETMLRFSVEKLGQDVDEHFRLRLLGVFNMAQSALASSGHQGYAQSVCDTKESFANLDFTKA